MTTEKPKLDPSSQAEHVAGIIASAGFSAKATAFANKQGVVYDGVNVYDGQVRGFVDLSNDCAKPSFWTEGMLKEGWRPTIYKDGEATDEKGPALDAKALRIKNDQIALGTKLAMRGAVAAAIMSAFPAVDVHKVIEGCGLAKYDPKKRGKTAEATADHSAETYTPEQEDAYDQFVRESQTAAPAASGVSAAPASPGR